MTLRRLLHACLAAVMGAAYAPGASLSAEEFDPNHPELMTVTPDITYRVYAVKSPAEDEQRYVSVIFTGGETIWVSPLFTRLRAEELTYDYRQLWMKGRLNEGGDELTIPRGTLVGEGQMCVFTHGRPYERFHLCPMVYQGGDDNFNTWAVDNSAGDIVMSVSPEGDMTLLRTDDTHGIGVVTQYGVVCFTSWMEGDNIAYGPYVINGLRLRPTDMQPVLPPPGLPIEEYQFLYTAPTHDIISFDYRKTIGRRVRCVTDGDRIYFQGLSYGDPGGWIAGKIEGGSVTFPGGAFSSLNTQSWYRYTPGKRNLLFAAREEGAYDRFDYVIDYIPQEGDIVFDYDSESGDLTPVGKDDVLVFTKGPDCPIRYRQDEAGEGYWMLDGHSDVFKYPALRRVPYGPQIPQQPVVADSRHIKGSYYDIAENVMRTENLFFRVFVDGAPLMFHQDILYNYWFEEPVAEIPVSMLYYSKEIPDYDSRCELAFRKDFSGGAQVTAELVYYQDGREYSSSSVGTVIDDCDPEDAAAPVYDLAGRRMDPGSLRPGIYIRNNKKIIVR